MGRNSSFDAGANGDGGIAQGEGMSQGPALAQGGPVLSESEQNHGWEGGFWSDLRHVVTNPTQTPYIGPEIRIGASLARSANSFATGGLSELPYAGAELLQGNSAGQAASDLWHHTPYGVGTDYAVGMGQGVYQAGRLASFVASNPAAAEAAVGKGIGWAAGHRNEARHLIASRATQTLRHMGSEAYAHPERAAIDVGLTAATVGAAGVALRSTRAAAEAAEVGAAAGEAGAVAGELGAAGTEATAEAAATAGRESAAVAGAGTEAADAATVGAATGEAAADAETTGGRLSRRLEKFDEAAGRGIEKRINRKPMNLVRRALGQETKELGMWGAQKEALAQKVAGEGGTVRELIAQRISPTAGKPAFSEKMSDWGRAYGEMKWRRSVATGDIEAGRKLTRVSRLGNDLEQANKIARDPQGYVMGKVESALGVHDLSPEQIADETQRRSNADQPETTMPFSPFTPPAPSGPHSNVPYQAPGLPSPTPLVQPPSGPPAPPGSGAGAGSQKPYTMGRGFRTSKGRGAAGFWNGRPEFTGASFGYDRMKLRPLTVARGGGITRFDHALASSAGALMAGRRGRETESNAQEVGGPVGGEAPYNPPMTREEGMATHPDEQKKLDEQAAWAPPF